MQAIVGAIQFVINKIAALAQFFLDVGLQVFVDLWEFITDAPVWVFEQLLDLILVILGGIAALPGFSSVSTAASWFGNIPAEMLNILGLIGLGYALSIIGGALLIRFVLGLIPFIRVGG
jgi:hypothetical protein